VATEGRHIVTTQITPLGERVLVRVIKNETQTETGIVLPDSVKNTPTNRGVVVSVPSGLSQFCDIAVGAELLYSRFAGNDVEIDGETHLILDLKDVLAVVG
jgi:chaperonin GroES